MIFDSMCRHGVRLIGVMSLALPVMAQDSCFEFFTTLPAGKSGACAELSFFGFDGQMTRELASAGTGESVASVDLFSDSEDPPPFFTSDQPVRASVELVADRETGSLTEFTLRHRGSLGVLPLAAEPPADVLSERVA